MTVPFELPTLPSDEGHIFVDLDMIPFDTMLYTYCGRTWRKVLNVEHHWYELVSSLPTETPQCACDGLVKVGETGRLDQLAVAHVCFVNGPPNWQRWAERHAHMVPAEMDTHGAIQWIGLHDRDFLGPLGRIIRETVMEHLVALGHVTAGGNRVTGTFRWTRVAPREMV